MARVVLVTGPAGIGKSRLRRELLRAVAARGQPVEVWTGHGDPMSAGSPFGMLTEALRQAVGLGEGEPAALRLDKVRAHVARHAPAEQVGRVTDFLGELIGAAATEETLQLRAARRDPVVMGDQMRRAFEDLVRNEARAHPLVLVLEDLHWGDLPTVRFVDSALRAARDLPFLVVAVARPDVHDRFPSLWTERGLQEIRLGELSKRASERLVRAALGETDPAVLTRVVEQASGNPLYLEELVRAVADGRDELPATVVAMVQTRLEALPTEARRVLRAASIFGRVFWTGGVAALLGAPDARDDELSMALETLATREVVRPRAQSRFPGEDELVFRHVTVRDAAYAMLTEEDRVLGHKLAAGWLEQRGDADALGLAEHLERGREAARAARLYRRAAEQALEGNDLDAAVARAERGAACGASGAELGALRLLQAEAHGWRGDHAERRRVAAEALAALPPGSAKWFQAAGDVAAAARALGENEAVAAVCADLLATPGEPAPRAVALARAARAAYLFGDVALGGRLLAGADPAVADDPLVAAARHRAESARARLAGDLTSAMEAAERSAQCSVLLGNVRGACLDWSIVGMILGDLGQLEDAEQVLGDMLLDAERTGIPLLVGNAKLGLAHTLLRLGRPADAAAVAESAAAIFAQQRDGRSEGLARQYLARALLAGGDAERAEAEARSAVRVCAGTPPVLPPARAALALALRARGHDDEARAEAAAAWAGRDILDEGEAFIAAVYADALAAGGADPGPVLDEARRRLGDRAARIADEGARSKYLALAENARLIEI
jgi:hypothetical protein